jgi:excinuclease UvrABC ATPase subunit
MSAFLWRSTFITGVSGSGKSTLIKKILPAMQNWIMLVKRQVNLLKLAVHFQIKHIEYVDQMAR